MNIGVVARSTRFLVKFDLFMEFASPAFAEVSATTAISAGIETAIAADRLGYDAVWSAEHHFVGDYSNAAAPDMLLAAIAQATTNIGLGFAILPLPLYEPVRVAEKLATLDHLSGGRALWGVGRGVTKTELGGFGIEMAESRQVFIDRYKTLRSILDDGSFERDGETYYVNPAINPDLAPGWLAAVSPDSVDVAADLGLNLMTGPFKPWPMVKSDIRRYRGLTKEKDAQTSFTMAVYCDTDHERARKRAEEGIVWVYERILEFARPLLNRQIEGYEHYRKLGWIAQLFQKAISLKTLEAMGLAAVGDPDHVAKKLRAVEEVGVDRIGMAIGGGDLSADEMITCLDTMAKHVLPRFRPAEIIPMTSGAA
jgi:alkanesulfonate monooxygenase SsuD/methylene tetrahydromethanopterin reductase-like flavin-dependent oxidoreductase (luciferase family)